MLKTPDRYEWIKLGPVGGQASIAHYRDKWLDRKVLLKAPFEFDGDITEELRALAGIRSKHVVLVFDTIKSETGKIEAIIQEEVPGSHLDDCLRSVMNFAQKLRLLYQIAVGVSDIHRSKLVHRDLKPT